MLSDMIKELMDAWDQHDAIRKDKAYKALKKVGVDAITANILVLELRKELKRKAEGGGS